MEEFNLLRLKLNKCKSVINTDKKEMQECNETKGFPIKRNILEYKFLLIENNLLKMQIIIVLDYYITSKERFIRIIKNSKLVFMEHSSEV